MPDRSLEERVAALEGQMGGKTLQEHFREQAELIDRLFDYRFDQLEKKFNARLEESHARLEEKLDAKFDRKLAELEEKLETKLEEKLETKLEAKLEKKFELKLRPIRRDLTFVKGAVQTLLARLPE
jgi:hypothetical protein